MNLRLYIFKRDDIRDHSLGKYIHIAVVDSDRSKDYPSNFVCVLPQQTSGKGAQSSAFVRIFGNNSLEMAKRLLTEAFETEDDIEIKAEIEKRLKLLEPKPIVQVKCRVCGNSFEPKRLGRFQQKICQECRRKKEFKPRMTPKGSNS
jgi:hypothetical protein